MGITIEYMPAGGEAIGAFWKDWEGGGIMEQNIEKEGCVFQKTCVHYKRNILAKGANP